MLNFTVLEDVDEWLAPLDYECFWREAAQFGLPAVPRERCDADIASGLIDEATVLRELKEWVRLELVGRYRLPARGRKWHSVQ